jgi:hypothetical protein
MVEELLERRVAAQVYKIEKTVVGICQAENMTHFICKFESHYFILTRLHTGKGENFLLYHI